MICIYTQTRVHTHMHICTSGSGLALLQIGLDGSLSSEPMKKYILNIEEFSSEGQCQSLFYFSVHLPSHLWQLQQRIKIQNTEQQLACLATSIPPC